MSVSLQEYNQALEGIEEQCRKLALQLEIHQELRIVLRRKIEQCKRDKPKGVVNNTTASLSAQDVVDTA